MAKVKLDIPPENEGEIYGWLCDLVSKLNFILQNLDEENMSHKYNGKVKNEYHKI